MTEQDFEIVRLRLVGGYRGLAAREGRRGAFYLAAAVCLFVLAALHADAGHGWIFLSAHAMAAACVLMADRKLKHARVFAVEADRLVEVSWRGHCRTAAK